jgi:ferredoxin-nitrite reductase
MQAIIDAFEERNKKVNKIEKLKEQRTPLEAFEQLRYYADNGYSSIPEEDKSFFLKSFGIFDRPQTPEMFMLRVRIPGGQLTTEQATVLGSVSRDYGNDYIDITTRMQVELRYLKIEDIPTVLEKLLDVGISTLQTGVDNFRNILTDPLDGVALDAVGSSFSTLEKMQALFLNNWDWISALPRKFNTSITSAFTNRCNALTQDCCFVLAKKGGRYGYNLYLGGKVGQIARTADIFVESEEELLACYTGLIEMFRDYGFRDNRNKNRLHFLIEKVGMAEIKKGIEATAKREFESAGDRLINLESFEAKDGRVTLNDGKFALHVVVPSGVFTGSAMIEAAHCALTHGDSRIRLSIDQNLYILGVKPEEINKTLEHKIFSLYKNVNTPYFNHMIACAGTEHCPFGVIPNKPDAINMSEYLSNEVPLEDGLIRMYWSACIKGCGIHGLGDIGFEGCKAKVDGQTEYGVHILMGGKMIGDSVEGHSVLKAVPLRFAPAYVAEMARVYRDKKLPSESFERFHDRYLSHYSSATLGFLMRFNAFCQSNSIESKIDLDHVPHSGRVETYELFHIGVHLYHTVIGSNPYTIKGVTPPLNSTVQSILKTDSSVNEQLASIIDKLVHHDATQRAMAVSELLVDLPYQ